MRTNLRASFGRADITPKIGSKMAGYGNRLSHSAGVHAPLLARALVLTRPAAMSRLYP